MVAEANVIAWSFTFYCFLAGLVKWQPNYFVTPEKYCFVFLEDYRWQFYLTATQSSSHCMHSIEIFLKVVHSGLCHSTSLVGQTYE